MSQKDKNEICEGEDTLCEDTLCEESDSPKVVDLAAGERIHRFHILELIGKGGMGAVYKAYDPELDRRIAIKILAVSNQHDETASLPHARIKREAKALARLNHTNVVSIYDVGTYNESVYIAMEYVEGKTLRAWLADTNPRPKEIIDVFVAAGRGLQAAHAQGIVHRDFKPENLIVAGDGRVKILDFGLATAAGFDEIEFGDTSSGSDSELSSSDQHLATPLTEHGTLLGTVVYMAPEHFLKQDLDEKTDQFSFCVTLFEALYGQRPFAGKTTNKLERNVRLGRITIPKQASVPDWIQRILLRGLSVSKEDRYPAIADLLSELQDDPEIRRMQRKKKFVVLGAILFAAALPFGLWTWFFNRDQLCQGAQNKLVGVWDATVQKNIQEAFRSTNLPYAFDTFRRVEEHLNRYTQDWVTMHTQSCQATRIRGEQSETMLDLSMICLSKRLDELKALNEVLSEADSKTVEKAIPAIEDLAAISTCANVEMLSDLHYRIKPPTPGKQKQQVDQLRSQLNKTKVYLHTGRYKQGDLLAQQVLTQAQTTAYPPLATETLYWSGMLKLKLGQHESAQQQFDQAFSQALALGYDEFVALAGTQLMYVVGYHLTRFEEGERIGRYAQAVLQKLRDHNELLANLYGNMGVVLWAKGDWQLAKDKLHRALELLNNTHDANPMTFSKVLTNLGIVYYDQGAFDKSAEFFTQAMQIDKRVLGSQHPYVAISLNNLGDAYGSKGNYAKAIEHHSQAFSIWSKAFGPDHLEVAYSHTNLGATLVLQGDLKKAKHHYQRALAIRSKGLGPDHPSTAICLSGLANVSSSLGDYASARKYHSQALRIQRKRPGSQPSSCGQVTQQSGCCLSANRSNQKGPGLVSTRFWPSSKKPCIQVTWRSCCHDLVWVKSS